MVTQIKNIVFDIGNVIVRWAPHEVVKSVFPDKDPEQFLKQIYPIWLDLNLGKFSESQAISMYHDQLDISKAKLSYFLDELKTSQKFIPGSIELLQKLYSLGFPLYSITDNVKEILAYHKAHSNFLHYFKGIISSSDVGIVKPDKRIFQYLLDKYELMADESVFIDDLVRNVEGAKSVGMQAFQFIDSESCEKELLKLGIGS